MAKIKSGRPTVITKSVVRLLEDAFLVGATDLEACVHADISKTALYEYCLKNEDFAERKETLKNQPTLKAKIIVMGALTANDLNTAHRVIDRKEGQKIKQDITSGGKQINSWVVNPVTMDKNG
jgi:hypothetical protein